MPLGARFTVTRRGGSANPELLSAAATRARQRHSQVAGAADPLCIRAVACRDVDAALVDQLDVHLLPEEPLQVEHHGAQRLVLVAAEGEISQVVVGADQLHPRLLPRPAGDEETRPAVRDFERRARQRALRVVFLDQFPDAVAGQPVGLVLRRQRPELVERRRQRPPRKHGRGRGGLRPDLPSVGGRHRSGRPSAARGPRRRPARARWGSRWWGWDTSPRWRSCPITCRSSERTCAARSPPVAEVVAGALGAAGRCLGDLRIDVIERLAHLGDLRPHRRARLRRGGRRRARCGRAPANAGSAWSGGSGTA